MVKLVTCKIKKERKHMAELKTSSPRNPTMDEEGIRVIAKCILKEKYERALGTELQYLYIGPVNRVVSSSKIAVGVTWQASICHSFLQKGINQKMVFFPSGTALSIPTPEVIMKTFGQASRHQ
jgi:hypothetical protein